MSLEDLNLTYHEITESDVPELTDVMTRAFDDDAQKHLGKERGGPDGYDNGEFFRSDHPHRRRNYHSSEGDGVTGDTRS